MKHAIHHTRHVPVPDYAKPLCLDSSHLLSLLGGAGNVKVLRSGNFGGGGREEDLDVTRVTLVGVAREKLAWSPRDQLSRDAVETQVLTFDRGLGKSSSWSWGPG